MNKGLRDEVITLLGISAAGALAFHRPKRALQLGLAAGALAFLGKRQQRESFYSQNVVITGGSRGLGLALARELVREGARVSLIARDADELERARQILLFEFPKAQVLIHPCDITKEDQMASALSSTYTRWGSIDMLINNAGSILVGPFDSLQRQDFEAQMELHLYAVISAVRAVLPHFRLRKAGRIVNICSMGGKVAVPHMLPYDTSKFALAGFSQGLTAELEREGISVTTVFPTLMRTGSPIQAVFKGDHEKEFAWFAAGDNLPGVSMSANLAAKKILQAARERRSELIPTGLGKVRLGAAFVFPELMAFTMALMNRLLPRGRSMRYQTGASSRRQFDQSHWNRFLRDRATMVEKQMNQEPKTDAKFNLGLLH
jgi:short-subunit dehydrogenase